MTIMDLREFLCLNNQLSVEVTLAELFRGVTKEVFYYSYVLCDGCKGVGIRPKAENKKKKCRTCQGKGAFGCSRIAYLDIPPKYYASEIILPNTIHGDICYRLNILRDPNFTVDAVGNLHYRKDILVEDALRGFAFSVNLLDGSTFAQEIEEVTAPDSIIEYPELGFIIPGTTNPANLIVEFKIDWLQVMEE